MTRDQRNALILCLVVCISYVVSVLPSKAQSPYVVHLPVVSNQAVTFSGTWQGKLTQPTNTFDFQLSLTQVENTIVGTSTIRKTENAYAILNLTGTISGTNIHLTETDFIEQKNVGGFVWCVKDMNLQLSVADGIPYLEGPWSDPGCNSGQVYLQQSTNAAVELTGLWKGTLSQGQTTYQLELNLTQTGIDIQGTSTIGNGTIVSTMRLTGRVIGRRVFITETEFIGRRYTFCLKELTATYQSDTTGALLNGNWSGCGTGPIALQKQ